VLVRCFSLRPSRVLSVLCVKDISAAKQETVVILKLHHYLLQEPESSDAIRRVE
jgi:hypothetical protein